MLLVKSMSALPSSDGSFIAHRSPRHLCQISRIAIVLKHHDVRLSAAKVNANIAGEVQLIREVPYPCLGPFECASLHGNGNRSDAMHGKSASAGVPESKSLCVLSLASAN